VVALVALALYLYLARGDLTSVGLTATPAQGWRYWFLAALLIGVAVAGFIALGLGAWIFAGQRLPIYTTAPHAFGTAFLRMCVFAPILEEVTYRLIVCVPFAAWGRPWLAIAASGLAFAALHLIYGNPSPENLVGGLFLAWAYLRSGTIGIPVLLHSLGNFCVIVAHAGAWYWLAGSA
jgi:uncharacterized protein